jgi:hypothetical protein
MVMAKFDRIREMPTEVGLTGREGEKERKIKLNPSTLLLSLSPCKILFPAGSKLATAHVLRKMNANPGAWSLRGALLVGTAGLLAASGCTNLFGFQWAKSEVECVDDSDCAAPATCHSGSCTNVDTKDPTSDAMTDAAPADAESEGDALDGSSSVGVASDAPLNCSDPRPPSYLLLFGGLGDKNGSDGEGGVEVNDYLGDTWKWDGTSWTQLSPVHSPPARTGASMATVCGIPTLFGGQGGQAKDAGYLNDTWTWNGRDWIEQKPQRSPPPRELAPFTNSNGTGLLFGGYVAPNYVGSTGSPVFGDTWTWNGRDWTLEEPNPSPPARGGASASALAGLLVLFGGDPIVASYLGDTWTWDGTLWHSKSPDLSPPPRTWSGMATLDDQVILFGGFGSVPMDAGGGLEAMNDTWAWIGTNWSKVKPRTKPTPRYTFSMATLGKAIVLFGGTSDSMQGLPDTWIWDGSDWSNPQVSGPPARFGAAMSAF